MSSKIKYVAAGFLEDSGKLLNEFLEANTVEFSVFASIWKNRHFSLVFMGRPEDNELTDFTNEAFRIAAQFLSTSSFLYQVGAIYLLYALFRNQISVPPIKIRIKLSQWMIINKIREDAALKQHRSLHYVIDYLISNALIYVKNQTLRGPRIASVQKVSKNSETISNFYANYKSDLTEYSTSNNLEELHDLQKQYLDIKKGIDSDIKLNRTGNREIYEKFIGDIDSVLNDRTSRRGKRRKNDVNIGNRRAELKAASFTRKPTDFWGRQASPLDSDPDDDFVDVKDNDYEPIRKKRFTSRRPRRAPKHERRVGRPRKRPVVEAPVETDPVENIDITYLLKQQQEFYLPPEPTEKGRFRTVRFPYYKLSPKHNEDSS